MDQQQSSIADTLLYKMKNPLKNRGHWLGLFYLTLSDISAVIRCSITLFY